MLLFFIVLFMGLAFLVIRLDTLGLLPMTARLLLPLDALLEMVLAMFFLIYYFCIHNFS